jgi:xylulokinase
MTESLLSLDVGTGSLKACVYDLQGNLLAKASQEYPTHYTQPGWAEQDPQIWWEACCSACRNIISQNDLRVSGITVSGQAPGCVPVDHTHSPLRPAILWLDRRSSPQVDWLVEHLGLEQAVQIGMNTLDSYFGAVKWLWYRQNEPDLYDRTWKILQANSFIILKLTGEAVIDPGHAGLCSPCFDAKKSEWSQAVCDLMDLDIGKLPPISPAKQVVGTVSAAASSLTGLSAGTPVVCGAPDFLCSFLGSGAASAKTAAMMLGTAGNLMSLTPPKIDPRLLNTIYINGAVISTGGVLAGSAVRWFGEMLRIDPTDIYETLDNEAALIEPGSEKLIFLPYLLGERSPIWDAYARGVYFGLTTTHHRGHLYRALLEGVAYAFRQLIDILTENGGSIEEIITINGGARSAVWRQIFADVLERPIRWRPSKDGTSLGGAYLAGVGTGIFGDLSGIQNWMEPTIDTFPDTSNSQEYRRGYAVYASLYEKLQDSFRSL